MDKLLNTAVAQRLSRVVLQKDEAAFDKLLLELKNAYTRAWQEASQKAIAAALNRMLDLNPQSFGHAEKNSIMNVLDTRVGGEVMAGLLAGPVMSLSEAISRLSAHEVSQSTGVDIQFSRSDLDALDQIHKANLFWIQNHWDSNTKAKFDHALTEFFEVGLTRDQLSQRFLESLGDVQKASTRYWNLLADHAATKTRELGRTTAYQRAGAKYVQIRAHLDAKTSALCRALHGRIISVQKLSNQRDDYLKAIDNQDKAAAKKAWVMSPAKVTANSSTNQLPANIASPPYHFRCRTITVVYFRQRETSVQSWQRKTNDRQQLNKKELGQLVNRAKQAKWGTHKIKGKTTLKHHYQKHGKTQALTLEQYNQQALDLIRNADRDIFLSVRRGVLHALFVRKGKRRSSQIVVLDMQANEIKSILKMKPSKAWGFGASTDDVPPKKKQSKARGIMKWFTAST